MNVMPIVGYYGPYKGKDTRGCERDYLCDEIYSLIKEAGIGAITYCDNKFPKDEEEILKALSYGDKYGIDMYVGDNRIDASVTAESLEEYISDYAHFDCFKGITIIDEPFTDYYRPHYEVEESRYLRAHVNEAQVVNQREDLMGYVNLNPMASFLGGEDYPEDYDKYVDDVVTSCKLKVLSFDYYLFDKHGYALEHGKRGYFDNLAMMRKKSKQHNIPFWPHIQAGSNWNDASTDMKQTVNDYPTRAEVFWNVNTSLAYGAKGIQYFPLIQPSFFAYEENGQYDYERNGVIGANHKPTKWYAYIKDVNAYIETVDEVLMNAESEAVLAIGEEVQNDTGITEASYGDLISVDAKAGALIGVFSHEGKCVYYVVNYDVENTQTIELHFKEGSKTVVLGAGEATLV